MLNFESLGTQVLEIGEGIPPALEEGAKKVSATRVFAASDRTEIGAPFGHVVEMRVEELHDGRVSVSQAIGIRDGSQDLSFRILGQQHF